MQKNDCLVLKCERLGGELEGICHHEGMVVFVPGMLPEEEGEVLIVKVQPRFAFGRLKKLFQSSKDRMEPFCSVFAKCGGCDGQHMCYEATLRSKQKQVLDCLTRTGDLPITEIPPVIGLEKPFRYRNKTAFPISGTADDPQLGFYRKRSHDVIDISECPVSMGPVSEIIAALQTWIREAKVQPYQEEKGKGLLRHAVTRVNRKGEVMLTLTATKNKLPRLPLLIELLKEQVPGFCSLHLSVNSERNNVILGRSSECLYGKACIEEELLGLRFEISPLSFFQVNPVQTERLYQTAIEFAALSPEDIVVDAYAGAGTISLCMAGSCKRVIGIEIVPQAVESAKRNAVLNQIGNAEFYTAAVEDLLPRLVREGLHPDVVVLDPPRKGCEREVLEAVIASGARRVVYVSCYVPTQARDSKILQEGGYRFVQCQSVDMFCWTSGVENVILYTKLS